MTMDAKTQELFDPDAPAGVELLSAGGGSAAGSGFLTQRLLASGGNVARFAKSLRTAALLKKDEWIRMDRTVIQVARDNLVVTQRLVGKGLTYDLPNALGTMQVDWERIGDMGPADMQMTALVREETDRVDFDLKSIPIPIIHKGFNINVRHLMASRNGSTPLDTTQSAIAARKVAEKIEHLIINGDQGLRFGAEAMSIPGMLQAPDSLGSYIPADSTTTVDETSNLATADLEDARRNLGTSPAGALVYSGWEGVSASSTAATQRKEHRSTLTNPQQLFNDVVSQVALLNRLNYFGPFTWYIPRNLWYHLLQDWSPNKGSGSILERLREIPDISEIITVPTLPPWHTVMIQETIDVVDIINGIQPTTVTWSPDPGFVTHFMIMAIIVPRFKSTKARQTGVLIATRKRK